VAAVSVLCDGPQLPAMAAGPLASAQQADQADVPETTP
jgi:hypothetical protein